MCLSKLTLSWEGVKADYIDEHIKNTGIKLSFTMGERCYFGQGDYNLSYQLKCDPTKEAELLTITKIQNCHFEFQFNTRYACQSYIEANNSSLFNSKKILIYFIALFCFYCVGFSYLNYKNNPEDGLMKAMPHREFWAEFFENVLLGVRVLGKFLHDKLTRKNDVGYY